MAVARITQIIGASPHSWEDAVRNALERANRTLRGITGIEVLKENAAGENGKIAEYRATLQVTVALEGTGGHAHGRPHDRAGRGVLPPRARGPAAARRRRLHGGRPARLREHARGSGGQDAPDPALHAARGARPAEPRPSDLGARARVRPPPPGRPARAA